MEIQRAYKTELDPNNVQRKEKLSKPNAIQLHKELNSRKKEDFPWMYEVSKCSPQEALRDLEKAFKNFFRGLKEGKPIGFPKFKSKSKGIGGQSTVIGML